MLQLQMPNKKIESIIRFVPLASRQKAFVINHEIITNMTPINRQILLGPAQQGHVRRVDTSSRAEVAAGQIETVA